MQLFGQRRRTLLLLAAAATLGIFLARPSVAQADGVEAEVVYVFNTFAFLVWGALVMWMSAGFAMLEAGSVRTKNASMICLKNIGLYSIAGLAYFILGYNLMYGDLIGNFIGSFQLFYGPSAEEIALVKGEGDAAAVLAGDNAYSTMSDWFFQMVFVAAAASIVSRRPGRAGQALVLLLVRADPHRHHLPHRRRLDLGRRLAGRSWDSRTSPAPPSCTAPVAGPRSPAS